MKKRIILPAAIILAAAIGLISMSRDDREFKISKNLDIFFSIVKELNLYYVEDPDPDRIVPAAINEMLAELDPYTTYIPEKDKDEYQMAIDGEYGGVGAIIQKSDTDLIQVREIYAGTPSNKAGLKAGDRILSIDGESMRGRNVEYVRSKLRGKAGVTIKTEIERPGTPKKLTIDITRDVVKLPAVEYYGMVDSETGYIQLRSFEKDCAKAIKEALLDLRDKQGAKRLILDLRGNTGGLLDESLDIVNLFVPSGSELLQTRGRRSAMDRTYKALRQPVDTLMPMAVMINRGSASASEIVSGALQDLDRAVIVGQRSFGKGLVQATREVAYDGYLKLTTAKYYTPSGRCIQAIDYSNRDADGAVGLVADSLISEYKTRNGRSVYDGGGISPDVVTTAQTYRNVTVALVYTDQIFSYVISRIRKGDPLTLDADGHISDADYNDFITYVGTRDNFKYRTVSQDAYDKLVAAAKADGVYDSKAKEFEALKETCQADLKRDMLLAKDEIRPLMEDETIRSTQLRRAGLAHNLQYDNELAETVKLLSNNAKVKGLLNGTVSSHAGDKRSSAKQK